MDEYLFITLAKLKADRLKLDREQRVGVAAEAPPAAAGSHSARQVAKQSPRASWSSHEHLWRDQS